MSSREEKKWNRPKHTDGLPHQTIEDYAYEKQEQILSLLKSNGLSPEEITHLTGHKSPHSSRPAQSLF